MYDGVFDFYRDRIKSVPFYGFKAGHDLLALIQRTALRDSFLTNSEYNTIINLCNDAHIKLMEDNFNAGWNEQNP